MAAWPGGGKYGAVRPPRAFRGGPYQGSGKGSGEEVTTIWVGNMPAAVTDADLLYAFSNFGNVLNAQVSRRPAASGAMSGFIRFSSREEGDVAIAAALAGQIAFDNTPVLAQWAKSNTFGGTGGSQGPPQAVVYAQPMAAPQPVWRPARPPANAYAMRPGPPSYGAPYGGGRPTEELTTLWLGNLPEGTTEADISSTFSSAGQVLVAIVHQRPSPMGSYSGFVRLGNSHEAEQALQWCNTGALMVNGAPVIARWAKGNSKVPSEGGGFTQEVVGGPAPAANGAGHGGYTTHPPAAQAAPGPAGQVRTLFLGGLPPDTTEDEVRQAFQQSNLEGQVSIKQGRATAKGLSGFIKFDTPDLAQMAFTLLLEHPLQLRGQKVSVDFAKQDTFS